MTSAERVLNALQYGAENAKTRGQLCAELGLCDRNVRQAIEDARCMETEETPFIVTACGGKGYYLTREVEEIARHYRGECARAMAILVRTKGERRFLKKEGRL